MSGNNNPRAYIPDGFFFCLRMRLEKGGGVFEGEGVITILRS